MEVNMDGKGGLRAIASGVEAVKVQAAFLAAHLRTQMWLRFGLYGLAAIFCIVAAVLIVFAPEGRETATVVVGIALFAIAAGCAGFGTFGIKAPGISATAGGGNKLDLRGFDDASQSSETPLRRSRRERSPPKAS